MPDRPESNKFVWEPGDLRSLPPTEREKQQIKEFERRRKQPSKPPEARPQQKDKRQTP